jgi:hypothetical protein
MKWKINTNYCTQKWTVTYFVSSKPYPSINNPLLILTTDILPDKKVHIICILPCVLVMLCFSDVVMCFTLCLTNGYMNSARNVQKVNTLYVFDMYSSVPEFLDRK